MSREDVSCMVGFAAEKNGVSPFREAFPDTEDGEIPLEVAGGKPVPCEASSFLFRRS